MLTRTFYLLREMPGRVTGAPVFVQQGGDPANDGVSPVVIGGNDYAAAWAVDAAVPSRPSPWCRAARNSASSPTASASTW